LNQLSKRLVLDHNDRILVRENGLWNLKGHFTVALEDNEDLEWACENGQYSAHVMIVTLFYFSRHFIILIDFI
jgi:hypothetical protein